MTRSALMAVLLGACVDEATTTELPVLSGDTCAVYTAATSCTADPTCAWYGTGCDCPPDSPSCMCAAGACGAKNPGPGSGTGSANAGCACTGGGVCYEQVGGTATTSSSPSIECINPIPGDGDPCARISDQGTCHDSATVRGLCVCDNGER